MPPPFSRSATVSCTTCRMGKAKAPVLPLPVSAATITSPPPRMRGIDSDCTGVGSLLVGMRKIDAQEVACSLLPNVLK